MVIGVIGDTHNNLRSVARIVEILELSRAERVVHTGDVTQPKVLDALSSLSVPIHGVFGNNDQGERPELDRAAERHHMEFEEPPLEVHWGNRNILIAHDPLEIEEHLRPHHALALHGHTHLHREQWIEGTLIFSPGECAGMLKGQNRIGLVDLDSLHCELAYF